MPAARYWRIVGVQAVAGGDLELSELHLYGASGRLGAAAAITSSHPPTAGALAHLGDDDTTTTCTFASADVRSGGFYIRWDLGADQDLVGVRVGAGPGASDLFVESLMLQFLNAGRWETHKIFGAFPHPGASAMGAVPVADGDMHFSKVSLLIHGDGADGSTTFVDSGPLALAGTMTAAQIKTDKAGSYGGAAIKIGEYGRVVVPHNEAFNFGNGDFTIEVRAWLTGSGGDRLVLLKRTGSSGYMDFGIDVSMNRYATAMIRVGSNTLISLADQNYVQLPDGAWYTFAITRVGSAFRWFVNGQLLDTKTFAGAVFCDPANALSIGGSSNGIYACVNSYIEEVRITKGVGRYTASYTPATGPFLAGAPEGGGQTFLPARLKTLEIPLQEAASAVVLAHRTHRFDSLQLARDVEVGGPGTIYGTTKTKGTPNQPAKARVVLLHQRSKLPVRETWSDPVTGAFAFPGIDTTQQFLTLAEDAAGNFRPVAANRLTPEVLP